MTAENNVVQEFESYRELATLPCHCTPKPTLSQALAKKLEGVGQSAFEWIVLGGVVTTILGFMIWLMVSSGMDDRHKYDADHAFEVTCVHAGGHLVDYHATQGSYCADGNGRPLMDAVAK